MDLHIEIKDKNGDILQHVNIYQDGSDSEGTAQLVKYICDNYQVEGVDE